MAAVSSLSLSMHMYVNKHGYILLYTNALTHTHTQTHTHAHTYKLHTYLLQRGHDLIRMMKRMFFTKPSLYQD